MWASPDCGYRRFSLRQPERDFLLGLVAVFSISCTPVGPPIVTTLPSAPSKPTGSVQLKFRETPWDCDVSLDGRSILSVSRDTDTVVVHGVPVGKTTFEACGVSTTVVVRSRTVATVEVDNATSESAYRRVFATLGVVLIVLAVALGVPIALKS